PGAHRSRPSSGRTLLAVSVTLRSTPPTGRLPVACSRVAAAPDSGLRALSLRTGTFGSEGRPFRLGRSPMTGADGRADALIRLRRPLASFRSESTGRAGTSESAPSRLTAARWWTLWARPPTRAVPKHPAAASPRTATELPQTLIGAVIGATTWFPPRMLPYPEVRLPPAETPPATAAPPRQPALASPRTPMALPQTLIGAVIGATTWLPPRMLRPPEVRLPPAETPPFTTAPPRQPAKGGVSAGGHRKIGRAHV